MPAMFMPLSIAKAVPNSPSASLASNPSPAAEPGFRRSASSSARWSAGRAAESISSFSCMRSLPVGVLAWNCTALITASIRFTPAGPRCASSPVSPVSRVGSRPRGRARFMIAIRAVMLCPPSQPSAAVSSPAAAWSSAGSPYERCTTHSLTARLPAVRCRASKACSGRRGGRDSAGRDPLASGEW